VHEVELPAGGTVDDADPAPGQARVDAEHPHACPPDRRSAGDCPSRADHGSNARSTHDRCGALPGRRNTPGRTVSAMSVYDLGKRRRRAVLPSPLFLAVLAVTVLGAAIAWTQSQPNSRFGDFGVLLFVLGAWMVSVCFHEFAHAYAAYRAGDRSVVGAGYLTLNPFKYTHPVLSIALPLLFIVLGGIGLPGGAVYLQPHAFRSRAMRSVASAAGPAVNIVLGVVVLLVAKSHLSGDALAVYSSDHARFWTGLAFLGFLQLSAALLNLLPVPGLDGYAIIEPYLDPSTQDIGNKVKPWGMLGVLVLIFYVQPLNNLFFDVVDWLYRLTGADTVWWQFGHEFFRFWVKNPL
jgi:Zn-dependent protease